MRPGHNLAGGALVTPAIFGKLQYRHTVSPEYSSRSIYTPHYHTLGARFNFIQLNKVPKQNTTVERYAVGTYNYKSRT